MSASSSSNQNEVPSIWFFLLLLFLPTQLGRHFWPDFSIVSGTRVDYLAPTLYITDIIVIILLFFWILPQIKTLRIENIVALSKRYWGFLFFILTVIIGILLAKNPLVGIYGLLKFLEFSLLGFFIAKTINIDKHGSSITAFLAIGILFESLLASAQFLHHGSIGGFFWFFGERAFSADTPGIANSSLNGQLILRPYATFPHPNVLAGYLLVAMATVITNYKLLITNYQKYIYGVVLMFGTFGLLLTLSRVAIFLWFLILLLFFLVHLWQKYGYSRLQKALIFIILISSFAAFFIYSPLWERITTISFFAESIVRREELFLSSALLIKEHPFFGVGLNNFLVNLPAYQKTTSISLYLQPAHNIFLLIAAETGAIGLSLFFWFMIKTYGRIMSHESRTKAIAVIHNSKFVILTSILSLGFFDHYLLTLQQGQLLLALVLGMCWAKRE